MANPQKTKKTTKKNISVWIISALIVIPVIYLVIWNAGGRRKDKISKSDTVFMANDSTNSISNDLETAIKLANAQPTENNYINLSLQYYNKKMFSECIAANQKAIAINAKSTIAYNNICSAYNELKNYKAAEIACKQALQITPDFERATNNLKIAQTGIANTKKAIADALITANSKADETSYNNIAYLYYSDFQFENSIKWYKKSLIINPKNASTYNNICAAYNELGNYTEAKKYCEQAITLEPTFTLAKNNLKVANDRLKK